MRRSAFTGGGAYMTIFLKESTDTHTYERAVALLENDTYVLFEVPPGKYEVRCGLLHLLEKESFDGNPTALRKERIKLVAIPSQ